MKKQKVLSKIFGVGLVFVLVASTFAGALAGAIGTHNVYATSPSVAEVIQAHTSEKVDVTVNGTSYAIITLDCYINTTTLAIETPTYTPVKVYVDANGNPVSKEDTIRKIGLIDKARRLQDKGTMALSAKQQIECMDERLAIHGQISTLNVLRDATNLALAIAIQAYFVQGYNVPEEIVKEASALAWGVASDPVHAVELMVCLDFNGAKANFTEVLRIDRGGPITDYTVARNYFEHYFTGLAFEQPAWNALDEIDEIDKSLAEEIRDYGLDLLDRLLGGLFGEFQDLLDDLSTIDLVSEYIAERDVSISNVNNRIPWFIGRCGEYTLDLASHSPHEVSVPDLTVTSTQATPLSVEAGDTISVTFTIKNTGNAPSGSFANRVFLSIPPYKWHTDIFLGTFYMDSLNGGSSAPPSTVQVIIPRDVSASDYYVTVYTDAFRVVEESDEMNNIGSTSPQMLTVTAPPQIDLTVTSLASPSSAKPGDTTSVSFMVKNLGATPSGSFTNSVFLSTKPKGTEIWIGNCSTGSLAAGASQPATASVIIPSELPSGEYYVTVFADGLRGIAETNETNNINTTYPDKIVIKADAIGSIELTPASHDFGDVQPSECSSPYSFTLENVGGGTATGTVSVTGNDAAEFTITSGEGSFSLGAGATKTIQVKFCPNSEGSKSATLVATGSNCNDASSSLSGNSVNEPQIELTPPNRDFGSIEVGAASSPYSFTLRNTGGGIATGTLSITGSDAGDFAFAGGQGDCSFSLGPGSTKTFYMQFCPASTGSKSATLYAAGSNCNDASSSLSGTAFETVRVSVFPSSWPFNEVEVGKCREHSFLLRSLGSGTATGTVYLTGSDAGDFNITSGGGDFVLAFMENKTIEVEFCPNSAGNKSATLYVAGSNCADVSSSLSGTGVQTPPGIWFTPSGGCSFGVDVGKCSSPDSLHLWNTGGGTANGTVYLTGSNASEFTITSGEGSFSLSGYGANKTIQVKCCPGSAGDKYATLYAEGSNCNDVSVPLLGHGWVTYNLTISSTVGGCVTVPGEGTFPYYPSQWVDLVAVSHSGYQFVNWTGDVDTIDNLNEPVTQIAMHDNYIITANFEEIPPAEYWARSYRVTDIGSARSIRQTSDGGYIVAGVEAGPGDNWDDFWVVKLDSSDSVQWEKTYGGNAGFATDYARAVQETTDGGYIVAGTTDSLGAGSRDFWVLKLYSSGNVQWQKTYGGTGWEDHASIQQTSDGGYVLAGTTESFGAGSGDFWVLKLDPSGSVTWQKTYGGGAYEDCTSLQQTLDEGYIIAGKTNSFGLGPDGGDFWVLKLNSSGNVQWQKTYGGPSFDKDHCYIQQTSDGGYIVAGKTESFGAGGSDFWVLKLNPNGDVQWEKTYGGADLDIPTAVQETSDGGYIVAGKTCSFGDRAGDFWVLKLAANGIIQWERTFGSTQSPFDDYAYSINETSDGSYVLAGEASFAAGYFCVLKLNSDGLIPPYCPLIGDSNATVTTTTANITNTSVSGVDTGITPQNTGVTPVNTHASVTQHCPCKVYYDLTVNVSPSSKGDIKVNGILADSYPKTYNYEGDAVVSLEAMPASNYHFVNWSGNISTVANPNANSTTVNMSGNYTITANFAIDQHTLTISSTSGGNVSTPGEGILGPYDHGTVVNLVATPHTGYHFSNWTGDSGTIDNPFDSSTTITMDNDYTIMANFAINKYYLGISGTSGGNVSTPGEGIWGPYNAGTVVNLVATASSGCHFVNWTGDIGTIADFNAASTNITMNGDCFITANFDIDNPPYFYGVYFTPFDSAGYGVNDTVEVETDADIGANISVEVTSCCYLYDPNGTLVDNYSLTWNISDSAIGDNAFCNLSAPLGSPEGWYDVKCLLYCKGDLVDTWWSHDVAYLWGQVPAPDLSIIKVASTPISGYAGQLIEYSVTVANQGVTNATGFCIDVYQDRDTPPTSGETGDDYALVEFLAAGENLTIDFPYLSPITYESHGVYNLWVQVDTDGFVAESDEENNIYGPVLVTIENTPPIADAGPDQIALVNTTITLDGSNSRDADSDPLSYNWTQTAGPLPVTLLPNSTVVNPSFNTPVVGNYTFSLVVNDTQVDSPPDTVNITIKALNEAPILSNGSVTPASGYATTTFTYLVNYTDADNDPPVPITISIDGGMPQNMTVKAGEDGNYTNGEIYQYIINGSGLGLGSHNFTFAASDGMADATGDIGLHDGPQVNEKSSPIGSGGGGEGGTPAPSTPAENVSEEIVPPTPANFVPSSLAISSAEVGIGEMVEISILVTNTGGQSGSYQVVLKINGVVEETKEITLAPAESKSVSFTTSKNIAGKYSVEVNGLEGSFIVTKPPPERVNWPLIGGIVGGIIMLSVLGYFLVSRGKRARPTTAE